MVQLLGATEALLRVLKKIEILPQDYVPKGLSHSDFGPIAHLANGGIINQPQAIAALSKHLGMPLVTLDAVEIPKYLALFEQAPVNRVKLERWMHGRALPLSVTDSYVRIVMANPLDQDFRRTLEFEMDREIRIGIGTEQEIMRVLNARKNSADALSLESVLNVQPGAENLNLTLSTGEPLRLESNVLDVSPNDGPVVQIVGNLFNEAVQLGASDIHLLPQERSLKVRARVDGAMRELYDIPDEHKQSVLSRVKLLCGMDISERRRPQDGRHRLRTPVGPRDLRVSSVPSTYGENIVIRILVPEVATLTLAALGMNAHVQAGITHALKQSSRIHLFTGPTGSGKTSSIYASLLLLRDEGQNIITLEDPIEYKVEGITQIQVNPKINFGFAEGLRSILRQDPDVAFVGEIRDGETASIAMQVAQTGHLVVSTLHTNSAPAAITRLRDLGIQSFIIASSLGSVCAQRLVRKVCPDCTVGLEESEHARARSLGLDPAGMKKAVGCSSCGDTGYKGRTGVYSVMTMSSVLEEAIRNDVGEADLARIAREGGYRSLAEAGLELVQAGVTSLSELERVLGTLEMHDVSRAAAPAENSHEVRKPRILIVEDDQDNADLLTLLLRREHYEVQSACNGNEAMEMIYQSIPDIIVSDIMMPVMSGTQLLRKLKSDSRLRDIPVLMLTANDSEEKELETMECGADDFVGKGTRTEILLARISRLVQV